MLSSLTSLQLPAIVHPGIKCHLIGEALAGHRYSMNLISWSIVLGSNIYMLCLPHHHQWSGSAWYKPSVAPPISMMTSSQCVGCH